MTDDTLPGVDVVEKDISPATAETPKFTARRYGRTGNRYTLDGEWIPGVTTVLEMTPKAGLMNYAAETTADYAIDYWDELSHLRPSERRKRLLRARFDDVDEAGQRGRDVHNLADRLSRGEENVPVPPELSGHVDALLDYFDEWRPRTILSECAIVNVEWGYGGRFDVVEELPDGTIRLADYKTKRKGIYRDAALQFAPYRHATHYIDPETGLLRPMAELGITSTVGVWIRSDGYSVNTFRSDERVFRRFCYLLDLWRANEYEMESWKGPDMRAPKWPEEAS